ncbi:Uncharacterised protein [Staphylococcus nepalensis]|jgi:hypothetical protein|nr:Uncharacterised protein [Staphylococcus nepalensis]SUM95946.1 Uncharacterised protein [Staphylococcus nepalensis]
MNSYLLSNSNNECIKLKPAQIPTYVGVCAILSGVVHPVFTCKKYIGLSKNNSACVVAEINFG